MIICGRSKNPFLSECAANIILEFTGIGIDDRIDKALGKPSSDSRFIGHFKAIAVLSDTVSWDSREVKAVVGVSSKTVIVNVIGVVVKPSIVNVKGLGKPSIVEPIAVLSDTLRRSEGDRLVSSDTAIAVLSDTATVLSDTPFDLTLLAAGVSSNTVIVKAMIGVSSDTLRQ
ncbi:hypothetical protein DPMN_139370 [Dreissena polymorpha]|uniref:Uncharacterized protein n=1 Tax=Dreissena polymorpha TaxID=45954 RepID=A0A9D4G5L1_DREPO|nr:hypothetical protein DPMN_139370 [Dreissena polymorpha]